MKNKKQWIKMAFNIGFIIAVFLGLLFYVIKVDGIDNIAMVLQNVEITWMILGLVCMLIYWLMETLNLYIISKKMYPNQSFRNSFRVTMIGQLFNCLTPFSSGGQPMQAVSLVREGKSVSDSASILLIRFLIYQITLVIYTFMIIVFQFSYFKGLVSNFMNLALIGFLVNLAVIIFLILVGVNQEFVFKLASFGIRLLGKIKLLKNVDQKLEHLKESLGKFHDNFKLLKKEKKMTLQLVILSIIEHTVFFSVTYMVYRSFGLGGVPFIKILSAQAFLSMVMAFVPIPGAGIAAEGGFLILFKKFFTPETINMGILFWRMYTFYLPIIAGAMIMVMIKKKEKSDKV